MDGWNFIRLVHALRQASLSISSQDILDAQTCLQRFPDLSEKSIAKAIFIHLPQDSSIFETVWRILVETSLNEQSPKEEKTKLLALEENLENLGIGGQGVGRGLGGISLTHMGTDVNISDVLNQIPVSRLQKLICSGVEIEDGVKTILAEMDYYTWINSHDLAYQRGALSEEEWDIHQDSKASLVHEIRQRLLTVQVSHENSWQSLVRQHWLFKPLSTLSEEEKGLVKSSIRKWSRKLAVRPGPRWKSCQRGTIDIARIVQKSVQWNGLPFRLSYRHRIPRVSELVVLCDVSNSMAAFVEFFIYLVTCLRGRFRKIRVFFFIDSVWDVSDFVWDGDLDGVKNEIRSWGHKKSLGFSDYGAVFKELAENKLRVVSSRATFVLLGDGKNNYRSAQPEYIAQISERVRNVVWLNPLDVQEWKEPDSIMKEYQPYCTKVFRCRSASDLQRVVKDIF